MLFLPVLRLVIRLASCGTVYTIGFDGLMPTPTFLIVYLTSIQNKEHLYLTSIHNKEQLYLTSIQHKEQLYLTSTQNKEQLCVLGRRGRWDPWSGYARRMGQPTQRATNYTARSNIDTAQIFLHANGQRPNRAMFRQRSRRRQRRGDPHIEHGLGVLLTHSHELPALAALAQHISHSHSGIDGKETDGKVC